MYVKTVYMVRLRLFPPDSKEIREVESAVFECAPPPPAPAPQFCDTFHPHPHRIFVTLFKGTRCCSCSPARAPASRLLSPRRCCYGQSKLHKKASKLAS